MPVQGFHQLPGDGGAESAAAKAAGDGRVGLGEAVEDARLCGFRNADAGIDDFEAQPLRLAQPDRTDIHIDPPMLGELDGIADQVDEDLAQVARIAMQMERRLRCDVCGQHQTFSLSLGFHHRGRAVDQAMQVEILGGADDPPGFDARDVEHVVDQFQQGVGRCTDDLGKFLLFLVELGVRQQVGDTDDAIQGRAELVAHVGEEMRFGLAGFMFAPDRSVKLFQQAG